jgi:hypothetical protein
MSDRSTIPIRVQTTQAPELRPVTDKDPHMRLVEVHLENNLAPTAAPRPQKNLAGLMIDQVERNSRVALVVAPEWSPLAPPYGVARMCGIARAMGFATRIWDINIHCKHRGPTEYWTAYEDWKWEEPHYSEKVHPQIEPILLEYINEVVTWAPTIIGFSTWVTNDSCTVWMAQQFRARIPGVRIIIGGANATQMKVSRTEVADHVVSGEGELLWIRLLENIDAGEEPMPHLLIQDRNERIDLDAVPPADYSDIDVSLYDTGGISCEFSRGCIANCVYCNETVFWKYRARQADRVLEEIETVYQQQGITAVWFIDSLLNGNLKQLRIFAEGMIERNIRLNWTGYSRIDGKMEKEFWQLLKQSGATGFAFGVESGSQKVLDLMKKVCRVDSIIKNFTDMEDIGLVNNFATFFTGFPGEEYTDWAQTMTLMWKLRNSAMSDLSSGTCGLGHNTPLQLERERFGVATKDWSWGWATTDLRNTVFHRFLRFKCTNIFLENFRRHGCHREYRQICHYPDLHNQYQLTYDPEQWRDDVAWEYDFDYAICRPGRSVMADSLINEIWVLLRVLWKCMGAFTFHMECEPERDLREFGYHRYPRGGEHRFWATYDFEIDAAGAWHAGFNLRLDTDPGWDAEDLNFHYVFDDGGQWSKLPVTNGVGDDETAGDHMHHHPRSLES